MMRASWKTIFSTGPDPANGPEPVFGGRPLDVVRHATARVMRLRVDPRDGRVRLTVPKRASLRRAFAWAEEQRGWVEAQLATVADRVRLVPGTVIEVGGEMLELVSAPQRSGEGRSSGRIHLRPSPEHGEASRHMLVIPGDPALFEARVLRWLKAEARRVLDAETRAAAARAGVTIGRVSVGDPRSRWGSCSGSGDIRYSWRLILAPSFVREATVVHEVAHRVHMNHGPEFKALERDLLGGPPARARAWLRAHGAGLHRLGSGPILPVHGEGDHA